MTDASGFQLIFDFEKRLGDPPTIYRYSVEIADDGRAGYATLHAEHHKRTATVWLYNRGPAPERTEAGERPALGREDALDWVLPPPRPKDFEVLQRWPYDWDFHVLIRGEFVALLSYLEPIGWARLARRDGAQALKPPRRGDILHQLLEETRDEIWDALADGPGDFLRVFARLSEPMRHLTATAIMHQQTTNGSLHQFFGNLGGGLAPEAARGFRALGLVSHAEALEQAMALFGAPFPRDDDARHLAQEALDAAAQESGAEHPLDALTTAFYAAAEDVTNAAERYARRAIPGSEIIYYAALDRRPGVRRP